jgi:hypothetical protein
MIPCNLTRSRAPREMQSKGVSRKDQTDNQRTIGEVPGSAGSVYSCRSVNDPLTTVILASIAGVWFGTVAPHAQNATWLGMPGSGVWNTGENCTGNTVPFETATFSSSTQNSGKGGSPWGLSGLLRVQKIWRLLPP